MAPYSDAEIDAAIDALSEPDRLREAQDTIVRAAPQLQKVLNEALSQGGWFDSAHESQLTRATGEEDLTERLRAVRTLLAEETRIGILVGVAVGFELARQLSEAKTTGIEES